jgi:hypothetical protein
VSARKVFFSPPSLSLLLFSRLYGRDKLKQSGCIMDQGGRREKERAWAEKMRGREEEIGLGNCFFPLLLPLLFSVQDEKTSFHPYCPSPSPPKREIESEREREKISPRKFPPPPFISFLCGATISSLFLSLDFHEAVFLLFLAFFFLSLSSAIIRQYKLHLLSLLPSDPPPLSLSLPPREEREERLAGGGSALSHASHSLLLDERGGGGGCGRRPRVQLPRKKGGRSAEAAQPPQAASGGGYSAAAFLDSSCSFFVRRPLPPPPPSSFLCTARRITSPPPSPPPPTRTRANAAAAAGREQRRKHMIRSDVGPSPPAPLLPTQSWRRPNNGR